MLRLFLAVIALAFVGGCATMGGERVEQLKSGTRIAPLSVMGEELAIRHVGTTVFQNERRDLPVPQWQIDRFTESAAARAIGAGGRFTPVLVETREARKRVGKMGSDFLTMGPKLEGGSDSVVAFAKQAGADYVLVLGPLPAGDPFMRTNQSLAGYGIYQRTAFGSRRAIDYLTMRLVLYDGRTGAEVARTQGWASSPRPNDQWMDSNKLALTPANAASTKAAIEALIQAVLKKNLAKLNLAH